MGSLTLYLYLYILAHAHTHIHTVQNTHPHPCVVISSNDLFIKDDELLCPSNAKSKIFSHGIVATQISVPTAIKSWN